MHRCLPLHHDLLTHVLVCVLDKHVSGRLAYFSHLLALSCTDQEQMQELEAKYVYSKHEPCLFIAVAGAFPCCFSMTTVHPGCSMMNYAGGRG